MFTAALIIALPQPSRAAQATVSPPSIPTLDKITARGFVACGVSGGLAGFGHVDDKGIWSGFDIDFCRALAVAVFGDPTKVAFTPLTAKERFNALRDGLVDVLDRNTTWTLSREANYGLLFVGVTYYDGQGFLVRRGLGIGSASALPSDTICVQQDTTTELNLSDFFRGRGLSYKPKCFATADAAEAAYAKGECGAYTTDASALYAGKAEQTDPNDHVILPEIISKEPLGPAVRQGDDQWFLVVRWTLMVMIDAEEMGVSRANVDAMVKSDNPRIKRLLGVEGNFGQMLGLRADWAYRILKFVGNYDDVFQRNLGDQSPLKIKRGLNALWTKGGLLYASPIQ